MGAVTINIDWHVLFGDKKVGSDCEWHLYFYCVAVGADTVERLSAESFDFFAIFVCFVLFVWIGIMCMTTLHIVDQDHEEDDVTGRAIVMDSNERNWRLKETSTCAMIKARGHSRIKRRGDETRRGMGEGGRGGGGGGGSAVVMNEAATGEAGRGGGGERRGGERGGVMVLRHDIPRQTPRDRLPR